MSYSPGKKPTNGNRAIVAAMLIAIATAASLFGVGFVRLEHHQQNDVHRLHPTEREFDQFRQIVLDRLKRLEDRIK